MQVTFDYTGATVMVVGGTSGINLGIAEAFAQAGAKVGVASRKQDKVDAAVATLREHRGEAMGVAFDVRDFAAVEAGLAAVREALGPFDALVSGAAGNFPSDALSLSPNGFKSVVDIDLVGTFHVMKAGFPHLKLPGAAIINISAPQAFVPMEFQVHVCAAKAGVDMVTKTLAKEWGPRGVRINSIVPGPIENTEGMARLAPTPDALEACRKSVPLRRNGTVSDVAQTALFLASPAASYVSGQVLAVDGAWSIGGVSGLMADMVKLFEQLKGA